MSRALKILSCNLWNGAGHPEGLVDILERLQPDLVLAQELSPEQADAIARVLPHGMLAPRRDTCGMGIASRQPIETRTLPWPRRSPQVARLQPGAVEGLSEPIEVMNVHLSAPTHVRSFAVRRAQIGLLERHVSQEATTHRVVAGDFNSFPGMPVYNRAHVLLRDVMQEHSEARGRSPAPTWSPTTDMTRLFRIDHVMATGLTARATGVEYVPGSDHSAVWAELTLD